MVIGKAKAAAIWGVTQLRETIEGVKEDVKAFRKREAEAVTREQASERREYETGGLQIICPNPKCDYQGRAKEIPKGSLGLGCLLMLFFVLPGILYLLFKRGNHYRCPRCGSQVASD